MDSISSSECLWDTYQVVFLEARTIAEENYAPVIMWQILASLRDVEEVCGNLAAILEWQRRPCGVIDDLADHSGSVNLRRSFPAKLASG